jgi:hypothetical protein
MPKPTVGRVVHFTTRDGRCLAGIITTVPIGAAVFEEGGQLSALTGWRTYRSEASEPHFWHWPERED